MTTSSRRLVFIADSHQFSEHAGPGEVATADFDVLNRLAERNRVDLWNYISAEEWHDLQMEAWQFCEELGRRLQGRIRHGSCDLAERCCRDLSWSVATLLTVARASLRAIRDRKPEAISVGSEMRNADFLDLPRPPADLFNAAAAWAGQTAGVRVDTRPSLPDHAGSAALFRPTATQAPASHVGLPEAVDFVSLTEQLGADEQALLLEDLRADALKSWAVVSTQPPGVAVGSVPLHLLRWLPIPRRHRADDEREVIRSVVREALAERRGKEWEILLHERADFMWRGWVEWLDNAARQYDVTRFLVRALRPRAVVMGYDVYGPGRCCVEAIRSAGASAVAVDHVGLGIWSDHLWNSAARAHFAVWGEFDAAGRRPHRDPTAEIRAVGSLRRDHATRAATVVKTGARPRIVLFTSQTSRGARMTGWVKPQDLRRVWKELAEAVAKHPQWDFVLKGHPRYDHTEFYETLQSEVPNLTIARGPAADVVSSAHAAVLVCAPSTVAVDAIRAGVPIVYLKQGVFPDMVSPLDNGLTVCRDAASLIQTLANWMTSEEARQRERERQQSFLSRALSATGAEAAARLRQFIADTAAPEQPAEQPGDAVRRWILEVISRIGAVQSGRWDGIDSTSEWSRLQKSARLLDPAGADELERHEVGRALLEMVAWGGWRDEQLSDARRLARRVRQVLPPSFRPPLRIARQFALHWLDREIHHPKCRRWGRAWRRGLCVALAPGRLRPGRRSG